MKEITVKMARSLRVRRQSDLEMGPVRKRKRYMFTFKQRPGLAESPELPEARLSLSVFFFMFLKFFGQLFLYVSHASGPQK